MGPIPSLYCVYDTGNNMANDYNLLRWNSRRKNCCITFEENCTVIHSLTDLTRGAVMFLLHDSRPDC
jgi:hypothetical protein